MAGESAYPYIPSHTRAYGRHQRSALFKQFTEGWVPPPGDPSDDDMDKQAYRQSVYTDYSFRPLSPTKGGGIGFRLPTSYFRSTVKFVNDFPENDFVVRANSYRNVMRIKGDYFPGPFGIPTTSTCPVYDRSVYDGVINDALEKLKDQKINLGVALAESRSTVGMVAGNAVRVFNAYRHIRKGRLSKALKALSLDKKGHTFSSKNASGRWLELQYGWLPLMSDIYGGYEQLNKGFREKDQLLNVRARRKGVVPFDPFLGSKGDTYFTYSADSLEMKYSAECKIWYKMSNDKLSKAATMGLTNPLEIAWELVPFSFVVDWFLPIGDFLSNLDATNGLTFVAGYRSHVAFYESNVHTDLKEGAYITRGEKPRGGLSAKLFQRTALASFPNPRLSYFKNPLTSGKRVANAIALFTQLRR